ncbi:hypothetical protein [Flagellimonas lutaonensis]|nr:hypothetical protein [Allomuricauda lutaonensis]
MQQLSRLPQKNVWIRNIANYSVDVLFHRLPPTTLKSWKNSSINAFSSEIKLTMSPNSGLKQSKDKVTADIENFDLIKRDLYARKFTSVSNIIDKYNTSYIIVHGNERISLNGILLERFEMSKVFKLFWNNQIIFILFDENISVFDYLTFLNIMYSTEKPKLEDRGNRGVFIEISNSLRKEIQQSGLLNIVDPLR